uniref:Nuclear receptor subfamily 2 group E member 1 n=1 Tax=Plectus sambesii TaxID=2011161 RepID=A0A914WUD4_9BILA
MQSARRSVSSRQVQCRPLIPHSPRQRDRIPAAVGRQRVDSASLSLVQQFNMTTTSSRILLDIPCKVCQDHSSGKHYGIFACDGCAGFFKRSIRRHRQYVCKNRGNGQDGKCLVDKTHRNQCRACRLKKCVVIGMNKDAVQHERGPRNSTLRRQMALYFKENSLAVGAPSNPTAFPGMRPLTDMHFSPQPAPPFPLFPSALMSTMRPMFPMMPSPLAPSMRFDMPPVSTALFLPSADQQENLSMGENQGDGARSATSSPVSKEHSLKEQAARLLFMTINWPKSLPQFVSLPLNEQSIALSNCWSEMFLLAASQFGLLTNSAIQSLNQSLTSQENIDKLRKAASQLEQLQLDPFEYSCLRAIALFKDNRMAADHMQMTMARYEQLQYTSQPLRSLHVFMSLSALRDVPPIALEQLFFKDSIGDVPMSRLVCDLYQSPSIAAKSGGIPEPPTTATPDSDESGGDLPSSSASVGSS